MCAAAEFVGLSETHGSLTPEDPSANGLAVYKPTMVSWWHKAEKGGRVGVRIMINPEAPPKVWHTALHTIKIAVGVLPALA